MSTLRTLAMAAALCAVACQKSPSTQPPTNAGGTDAPADPAADPNADTDTTASDLDPNFEYVADQFGDLRVLRYQVPGFSGLSLHKKQLAYYLYKAALSGRDIIWDQNYRHNLQVRRTLEAIATTYSGERSGEDWDAFLVYAKRVWFSNGIHHHYSMKKILPDFDKKYFATLVEGSDPKALPLAEGETPEQLIKTLTPILLDPKVDAKRVDLDPKVDMVRKSATNYYGPDVKQKEVERFYAAKIDKDDPTPISWGLNSQLVKEDGKLVEKTWKVGGMYSPAITEIVKWLELAIGVAESEPQKKALQKLVEYYETGDLKKFDEYSIAWVADTDSRIDVVNGFIEVYGDPLGYRGAYESVVSMRDQEASKRMAALSAEAQWFEDHSTIPDEYKKKNVTGISAKVITVIVEAGDASPSTPIGINLPNANWIRAQHGSKSVNLGNIVDAYDESSKQAGVLEEFAATPQEVELARAHGSLADKLHTDLHEVIGHASGAIKEGVGTPKETLKNYSSTLEEGRADLVALYYLYDQKLVDLGVMPSLDVGKAAYDDYIRNAMLVQLARLEPGEQLEEAHMRNRQMVAKWVIEKGKADNVVERIDEGGKTRYRINDYDKLRVLFGQLLREVQRIKSEGDYAAGKKLVETYGVKVDRKVHDQVLKRYAALKIAPYVGFINPRLVPVEEGGKIVDVKVEYPKDFMEQMLEYGKEYSLL